MSGSVKSQGVAPGRTLDGLLEWGVAHRCHRDETVSGDRAVIALRAGGVLFAVLDGLGHGPAAAHAAAVGAGVIDAHSDDDLVSLAERCDRAMRMTRGAAAGFALVTSSPVTLTWLAVGNVTGCILRGLRGPPSMIALPVVRGALGVPWLRARLATQPLQRGDLLAITTDGIQPTFADHVRAVGGAHQLAEGIVASHARPNDDALAVIVRYLGRS